MPLALRAAWNVADQTCPREPDWSELYAILGDKTKQDEIRARNPEARHCKLLLGNPRACHGCPHNPYGKEDHGAGLEILHGNSDAVERALWLEQTNRSGLLSISEMDPAEIEATRIVQEEIERQQRLELSKLIGYEVAVVIGKMFSGK